MVFLLTSHVTSLGQLCDEDENDGCNLQRWVLQTNSKFQLLIYFCFFHICKFHMTENIYYQYLWSVFSKQNNFSPPLFQE